MPQPYRGKEAPIFGPQALLKRPHLAAYIGAIATGDEIIQEGWGVTLAQALRSDAKIGAELYLSLTGSAAQSTVLGKAMEIVAREDPSLGEAYSRLRAMERGRGKERNRVVHGRWGILESREDVLVLGERDWLTRAIAELNHYYERVWRPGTEMAYEEPPFELSTYRKQDFEAILARQQDFLNHQQAFIQALLNHQDHVREKQRQEADWREHGLLTAAYPPAPDSLKTTPE